MSEPKLTEAHADALTAWYWGGAEIPVLEALVAGWLAEAEQTARADAWDEGWHEHHLEHARQREDPEHPITRRNPYRKATP